MEGELPPQKLVTALCEQYDSEQYDSEQYDSERNDSEHYDS